MEKVLLSQDLSTYAVVQSIVSLMRLLRGTYPVHYQEQFVVVFLNEPRCEKTGLQGLRPVPTLTGLYNCIRWLEA